MRGQIKRRATGCSVLCVLVHKPPAFIRGPPDFRLTRRLLNPDKEITFNVQANLAPIEPDTNFPPPPLLVTRDAYNCAKADRTGREIPPSTTSCIFSLFDNFIFFLKLLFSSVKIYTCWIWKNRFLELRYITLFRSFG